ncbi:MAG: MFS transporter [Flavobacteriales bacterium]|nr:MFS transporter [Flavobacteriales bacterium]
MVLAPLGYILLEEMNITATQFAWVVSAYALSAGVSGFLSAGFADKFDRKKMLLFFYVGFIVGTLFCGIATSYIYLLLARIVTGIFGGVLASISFAIITDLFELRVRGRVMGFVQMAFAASQVFGLPIGLELARRFNWHMPFLMIAGLAVPVWVLVFVRMKPVDAHLKLRDRKTGLANILSIIKVRAHLRAFLTTTLLAVGGYMLMPFSTPFLVKNVHIEDKDLFWLYTVTGIASMIAGPLIGRLSDRAGKFKVFVVGSVLTMILVGIYTNLPVTPLRWVMLVNAILFMGITARIISASALLTAVPEPASRGGFMAVNSSVQQISGGIASIISGMIVYQADAGRIMNYNVVGLVVIGTMIICVFLMWNINRYVFSKKENA